MRNLFHVPARAAALLSCSLSLVLSTLPLQSAQAQTYPNKTVRIIVPYATGGGSDTLARQVGANLQKQWGQGVVVENRAGASGNIGTEAAMRAPADGYTLLLQNSSVISNAALGVKFNFDPEKDFTPIMILGITPIALVANPSLNVKNMAQLQAYAKANPGKLSYGSCGIGTAMHFIGESIKQTAGIDAVHAGYKGCSPAIMDAVAGQVPLAIISANLAVQYAKAGRLNVLAISSPKRYSLLPDIPTFKEQGINAPDLANWYALMAPAKLPPELVKSIAADVNKALADPEVKASLSTAGIEPLDGNDADLTRLLRADKQLYEQLAKSLNIKAE